MASFKDIINSPKPVLVDFAAEWCRPCQMMKPILQELKSKLGDDVTIITIDVDRNLDTAHAYSIMSVPTLMIFKNGQSVWRQSGIIKAEQLASIIKRYK